MRVGAGRAGSSPPLRAAWVPSVSQGWALSISREGRRKQRQEAASSPHQLAHQDPVKRETERERPAGGSTARACLIFSEFQFSVSTAEGSSLEINIVHREPGS